MSIYFETDGDCISALNDRTKDYKETLNKIIGYIKNNKSFHSIYVVLKELNNFSKENKIDAKVYFIQRINKIVESEIKPLYFKKMLGLHQYFTENVEWKKKFDSSEFKYFESEAKAIKCPVDVRLIPDIDHYIRKKEEEKNNQWSREIINNNNKYLYVLCSIDGKYHNKYDNFQYSLDERVPIYNTRAEAEKFAKILSGKFYLMVKEIEKK